MDARSSKATLLSRIKYLELELSEKPTKEERVYMQCLNMTLEQCGSTWKIGGKNVNSAEMYCKLAKAFADNAITNF